MNNDLISRKAVIELIENCHVMEDAYCLIDYINDLPTAYDVEKVAEQLRKVSVPGDKILYLDPDKFGIYVRLEDAEKIVMQK